MPRISVERDDQPFRDRLRSYEIVLDGETVGRVKRGETVDVVADAGHHELHLTIDWARSPSVEFDLAEGQECLIRCWSNVSPRRARYFMTQGRDEWIGLEMVDAGQRTHPSPD
jgi:hypothetical protein